MAETMLTILFISLLYCHIVSSQINGEFWWLHEKAAQLQNIAPPPPKFEDISEFETDESVKIIFRDDFDATTSDTSDNSFIHNKNKTLTSINFQDKTAIGTLNYEDKDNLQSNKLMYMKNDSSTNFTSPFSTLTSTAASSVKSQNEDVLNFLFPEDENVDIINSNVKNKGSEDIPPQNINHTRDVPNSFPSASVKANNKVQDSESICTFIKSINCVKNHGFPYSFNGRPLLSRDIHNDLIVCCIMPLKTYESTKIFFPDITNMKHYKRIRRSVNSKYETPATRQRNTLMNRKYQSQSLEPKMSTTTPRTILTQRIVTPEDYVDPYWNVKNSKFRNPLSQESVSAQNSESRFDYSNQEYAEELPKPGGLVGLYSDHNKGWAMIRPSTGFSYSNYDEVSEEGSDGDFSFGYSTIDPRLERTMAISETRRKPSKIMTPSPDGVQNKVISFRSKPDFQVFHGFRLRNLVPNKNRFVRKTTQHTLQNGDTSVDEPYKTESSHSIDYKDYVDSDQMVYRNCGKTSNNVYHTEKGMGDVGKGEIPWIALVVLTRSRQSILCYATLVHPRAALTAADCVFGTSEGEITIIAGIFELSVEIVPSQHRITNVITHPQYKPGQLNYNVAVLHWNRPLILGNLVQPACMSDPHLGDECYFVGWSGYDEAIRQRLRWQRATILSPKVCNVRLSKLDVELPTEAFCASISTPTTVTGVGGPLLCMNGDRQSIVGVAVWRDSVILTLPVLEWAARMVQDTLI